MYYNWCHCKNIVWGHSVILWSPHDHSPCSFIVKPLHTKHSLSRRFISLRSSFFILEIYLCLVFACKYLLSDWLKEVFIRWWERGLRVGKFVFPPVPLKMNSHGFAEFRAKKNSIFPREGILSRNFSFPFFFLCFLSFFANKSRFGNTDDCFLRIWE